MLRNNNDHIRQIAAAAPVLIGLLALLDRKLDLFRWTAAPHVARIEVGAALSFIAIGAGFVLLPREAGPRRQLRGSLAAGLGAAVLAFALLTLFEIGTGASLGVDELLVSDATRPVALGRIALATAIGFACSGAALILLTFPEAERRGKINIKTAHLLALGPSAVGYLAMIGYAYDFAAIRSSFPLGFSPPGAALNFLMLAVAILSVAPNEGWREPIAALPIAGWLLERLLAMAILAPLVMGAAMTYGVGFHYYSPALIPALLAFFCAIVTVGLGVTAVAFTRQAEARLAETEASNREGLAALRESEERLSFAQTAAGIGIWDWDLRTNRRSYNQQYYLLCGVSEGASHSYEDFLSIIHPEDRVEVEASVQRMLAGERDYAAEYRLIRPCDGCIRWFRGTGKARFDEDRQPVRATGAVFDITARKEAEDSLRAALFRQEATFENAAVGIAELGLEGRFLRVNDRLCAIAGYTREELLGMTFSDVVHPEDLEANLNDARRLKAGEIQSYAQIKRYLRKDREPIWVNLTVGLARRPDRSPDYFVAVVEEISARKRAEERLLESEAALKDADRRKDEFLATLGHELRNPLAPIRNGLHVLQRLAVFENEKAKQICDMMDRQLEHLIRLVDDLLEVSRITRGKIELKKQRVDIATVIKQAIEISTSLIAKGKHELTVALPSETLTLDADPVRLTQVLANLLNNAAKYTEAGGSIAIRARREGDEAVVSVTDNGVGIRRELLSRVFDLFAQFDGGAGRAQGGLGIGLALVRNLVEMHGGRVEVSSAGVGQGSEFTLWLPLTSETTGESPPRNADAAVSRTRRRVLIVDDTRDVADSFALLVKTLGAEVRVAYDGPSALAALAEFSPQIVFMDLGMPEMDGFETAKALRQEPGGKDLRLVALSGWGQDEDRRLSEEAGFDQHFVKPMDMKTLQALLVAPWSKFKS
jgi:PAS domain S-box-containing protein